MRTRVRRARELPCAVELVHGSMLDLTWPDDSFDAVWCANIIEYFDDDQLAHVLRSFYRVTRPGGLVAVKDWDGSLFRFAPGPPTLFWHLFERAVQKDIPFARNVHGFFRLVRLDRLFEDIGFVAVRQSTTLLDHRAPLTEAQRVWCVQALEMFREVAATLDLPASDLTFWESLRDPAAPAQPIHHPMFLFGEANTMAVATVPGGSDED